MEPGTFSGFLGIPGERRRKHGTGIPDVICVCWRAAAVAQRSTAHPFRDGKGRISGIVQSLVLAREGLLAREFSSIEEYPGYHTTDYYRVLRAVQGGSTSRPATPGPGFAAASMRTCSRPAGAHRSRGRDPPLGAARARSRSARLARPAGHRSRAEPIRGCGACHLRRGGRRFVPHGHRRPAPPGRRLTRRRVRPRAQHPVRRLTGPARARRRRGRRRAIVITMTTTKRRNRYFADTARCSGSH